MRAGERGFTLVELLMGTTILLVVVTGVYTSFSLGLTVRDRCRSEAEELQSERRIAAQIADDLRRLAPVRPNLVLEADAISMLQPAREVYGAPEDAQAPYWVWVRYRSAESLEGERFVVREVSPVITPWEEARAELELGYELANPGEWMPTWLGGVVDEGEPDLAGHRTRFPGVRSISVTPWRREPDLTLVEGSFGIVEGESRPEVLEIGVSRGAGEPGAEPLEVLSFEVWLAPVSVSVI